MNFDLSQRIADTVDEQIQQKIASELDELQELLNKKVNELNTIKLLQYLKDDFLDYKVSLEVKFNREDNEYTWECKVKPSTNADNDNSNQYNIGWIVSMSQELTKNHYSKSKISFMNNEIGRDKLIEFMIGENWQQWKKEGKVIEHYEMLSNKIPSKKTNKEFKNKI